MPGYRCHHHGNKMALVFCDHAGLAVEERRNVPVFLQRDRWGWRTLCEDCARQLDRPEIMDSATYLICTACVTEWAELTGNRYSERARQAKPEFPPDLNPTPGRALSPSLAERAYAAQRWIQSLPPGPRRWWSPTLQAPEWRHKPQDSYEWTQEERVQFGRSVEQVVARRSDRLGPAPLTCGDPGNFKLFACCAELTHRDLQASAITAGFFDESDLPAWDCWLGVTGTDWQVLDCDWPHCLLGLLPPELEAWVAELTRVSAASNVALVEVLGQRSLRLYRQV